MKKSLLTTIRNTQTTQLEFRRATEQLGLILAAETSQFLTYLPKTIQTPLEKTDGMVLSENPILIPIMRAGLTLLHPFLQFYPEAKVGFIGMRRDEKTAIPHLYYENLPKITSQTPILILEPIIATGGSLSLALEILLKKGASEDKIILVSILGVPEGVNLIKTKMPQVKIIVVQVDKKLNSSKFIVPGLGDFGDRYFGTD